MVMKCFFFFNICNDTKSKFEMKAKTYRLLKSARINNECVIILIIKAETYGAGIHEEK